MAIQKQIVIDEKEVVFKASAAIPRIYRMKYGRDIFKDLSQLETGVKENNIFSFLMRFIANRLCVSSCCCN